MPAGAGSVLALEAGLLAEQALEVALDRGGELALALFGRLLVGLAPADLVQRAGLFDRALETPHGNIEALVLAYPDCRHILIR